MTDAELLAAYESAYSMLHHRHRSLLLRLRDLERREDVAETLPSPAELRALAT